MMHRTQIMLEETQYERLRQRAQSQDKSMGQLVRELVHMGLQTLENADKPKRRLNQAKGMFLVPYTDGRDHDRHLYGGE